MTDYKIPSPGLLPKLLGIPCIHDSVLAQCSKLGSEFARRSFPGGRWKSILRRNKCT